MRATLVASFVFTYVFAAGTPVVLLAWTTGWILPLYRVAQWGARMSLRLAGIRFTVTGEENIPRGQTCVYMANHQSNVDPPLLFVILPPRIAMMGKRQVFWVPVLGAAASLGGFVSVHREDPEEAKASVEEALEKLRGGLSFLVFPEGTRSPDGQLLPFKHGVFVLALRAGVPIVPITIDGATNVMAKRRWELYPGRVRVTIHPTVETSQFSVSDRHQLAEEVRSIVASALPEELRAPTVEPVASAAESDELL